MLIHHEGCDVGLICFINDFIVAAATQHGHAGPSLRWFSLGRSYLGLILVVMVNHLNQLVFIEEAKLLR